VLDVGDDDKGSDDDEKVVNDGKKDPHDEQGKRGKTPESQVTVCRQKLTEAPICSFAETSVGNQ
jgi:hypothetical protein